MEDNEVREPDYTAYYTAQDYAKWTFEGLFELIKGRVWKMSPAPSASHQRVCFELTSEFSNVFRRKACQVFFAPFDVYLVNEGQSVAQGSTVVQPDLCVICDAQKIEEKGCIGAPDLVVEILSPSTAKKDLNDKYSIYQEFGVKEYWVVFPFDKAITLYVLHEGSFVEHASYAISDRLQSHLFPELSFELSEVF